LGSGGQAIFAYLRLVRRFLRLMKKYSLSWVIGVGDQVNGGNKKLPAWQDVDYYLDKINIGKGSLRKV
ncbi:hypothetical protein, partial [Pseudomonas syringae]|uniref:hypothetical protein n=1 Tax=Pseudomonas syringae TaxID=317 RepID=UPI001C824CB7